MLPHTDGDVYTDLSLLSSSAFMLPVIHRFPSGNLNAIVKVYDFSGALERDEDGIPVPRLLRTFFLPPLNPQLSTVEFTCCSSLTNRRVWMQSPEQQNTLACMINERDGKVPSMASPKPFRPHDSDRLCALILDTFFDVAQWDIPYSYVFLTRASTLLAHYDTDWVPWRLWGEENASCLYGMGTDIRWGNFWYPHGFRIVLALRSDSHFGPLSWRVDLLDFNQDRVRRYLLQAPWPACSTADAEQNARTPNCMSTVDLVSGPRVVGGVDEPGVWGFQDRVINARLPYLRTKLLEPTWTCDWVEMDMDTERILLAKVRDKQPIVSCQIRCSAC